MPLNKKSYLLIISTLLIASLLFIFQDSLFFTPDDWQQSVAEVGSASSPRAADFNGDDVLDIVIGAGGKEFRETEYGVLAFDGADGSLLWHQPARNQITGSAVFQDINEDSIPDVIIGGRSAILYALDGRDGSLLWEYLPDYEGMDAVNDTSILNFFTPQFIPDVDNDQMEDLLVSYGGFVKATAGVTDRPAGSLMVISSRDGKLVAKATVPDGLETYTSPVIHDFAGNGALSILFGTGGETINGYLYLAKLEDVLKEDLSGAVVLDSGLGKGFIAPPVLTDINQDGTADIVANAVNGRMLAIDGSSHQKIWETSLGPGYEVYTMPAPGHFVGDDETPDFFASFGYGVWPSTKFTLNILLDGRDGSLISKDTLGTFQYASPMVFDFTEDGHDDILVTANLSMIGAEGGVSRRYGNQMKVFDVREKFILAFEESKFGSNLGSTPLITDLDNDGKVDIISCYMSDAENFYSFKELRLERRELDISIEQPIRWGAYMGSNYSAIFE